MININIDDNFSRLTVKNIRIENKERVAFVKCECGITKWVKVKYLINGDTRSCGCLQKDKVAGLRRLEPYKDIARSYFNSFKRHSKQRGLEFNITIEDVWEIWQSQRFICALTGEALKFSQHRNDCTASASIDRIDSSKGYTKDNIQIVHKDINRLKNNYNQEDFINMCRKVVNHIDLQRRTIPEELRL